MKDRDSYFRGACNSCECQEYANDGGIKCADCRCPASRHKLNYWTSPKVTSTGSSLKSKKYSLGRLNPLNWVFFEWLSHLNPFSWIALNWISILGIEIPLIGFNSRWQPRKEKNKLIETIERIPIIISSLFEDFSYPKLWEDFLKSIPDLTKMPNIDSSLQVVDKFQKRLPFALAALGAISVAGVLGFSGSHLNLEILDSAYIFSLSLLVIGAAFSFHIYLTSESLLKRTVAVVLFGMNSFSVLVYFLFYLGITPKLYGPQGIPIQTARFIDWNLSLPCIIEIFSLVTTGEAIDNVLDFKAQIFTLSLLISSGQLTPLCEIVGGFGIFLIATIFLDIGNQFSKTSESKNNNQTTISYLHSIIFWSLSLHAITWIFGFINIFAFLESEIFYSVTDAGLKFGFMALVLSLDKIHEDSTA